MPASATRCFPLGGSIRARGLPERRRQARRPRHAHRRLRLPRAAEPPSSEKLADGWRPYIETCIEAFGAGRCMFESNFPVDKGSYGYAAYWNACKRLAKGASATEKADLFGGTAKRFYKLDGIG